jgi:cyclopropane fatty-acyl-phospholipid synthase-like methyltransferase
VSTYDGYTKEHWMDGLTQMDAHNVRHILSLLALLGVPGSYLDVGCGTGIMVKTAERLGLRAYGVDQLVDGSWPRNFFHQNLVDRFELPEGPVELVSSFEVAEHLHESAHATFCGTLCDNLAPGGHFLIFSAARPGQDGTGHVACRPAEYWHKEFVLRGLSFNRVMTMNLGLVWSNIGSPLSYMWDNLMVFEKP